MTKVFLFVLIYILTLEGEAFASYSVNCNGFNSQTGSYVYGQCTNGSFAGYDSSTGSYIYYGNCAPNGALSAYDPNTGAYIYGSCGGG